MCIRDSWIIILIVLVFDPLAILLVISANMTWMQRRGEVITAVDIDDSVVEEVVIPETPEPSEFTDSEIDQFRRLDKKLRTKLGWLIDKEKDE